MNKQDKSDMLDILHEAFHSSKKNDGHDTMSKETETALSGLKEIMTLEFSYLREKFDLLIESNDKRFVHVEEHLKKLDGQVEDLDEVKLETHEKKAIAFISFGFKHPIFTVGIASVIIGVAWTIKIFQSLS